MQKFASAAVYFTILSIGLAILLQLFGESVLNGDNHLSNPLMFALAVLVLGLLTSLIYWLFNCLLKGIMSAIMKKETNGLNHLSTAETTLIGFAISIIYGVMCFFWSKESQELEFMHQMLFSLPVAKLAFITTSAKELWGDIIGLLKKSIRVWPFVLFILVEFVFAFFCEKYPMVFNVILMLVVVVAFLYSDVKRSSQVGTK